MLLRSTRFLMVSPLGKVSGVKIGSTLSCAGTVGVVMTGSRYAARVPPPGGDRAGRPSRPWTAPTHDPASAAAARSSTGARSRCLLATPAVRPLGRCGGHPGVLHSRNGGVTAPSPHRHASVPARRAPTASPTTDPSPTTDHIRAVPEHSRYRW